MNSQLPASLSLWELAVLSLLREATMHPYEMQKLLKQRHKDEVLVLKRGSLYHAIGRLERAQLIEPVGSHREGRRPERTTYQITSAGQQRLIEWLRQRISRCSREPSEFMATLSFLVHLSPEDAAVQLEQRMKALEAEIAEFTAKLKAAMPRVGRINLLESEYARAMRQAELAWVRSLLNDLRAGRLDWNIEAILEGIRLARASATTA